MLGYGDGYEPLRLRPVSKRPCYNVSGSGRIICPNQIETSNVLVFEDFLYVTDLILNFAFDLLSGASVPQIRIADNFAGLFFYGAHRLFSGSLCFILIA